MVAHRRGGVHADLHDRVRNSVSTDHKGHRRAPPGGQLSGTPKSSAPPGIRPGQHRGGGAPGGRPWVDEAVSKTVNLPSSARASDVYDTYAAAFEAGCKGITVYFDGSRD
ncbi:hypothetical protein ACFWX2_10740, partial [Amycolatopsis sp. NPDC059020]